MAHISFPRFIRQLFPTGTNIFFPLLSCSLIFKNRDRLAAFRQITRPPWLLKNECVLRSGEQPASRLHRKSIKVTADCVSEAKLCEVPPNKCHPARMIFRNVEKWCERRPRRCGITCVGVRRGARCHRVISHTDTQVRGVQATALMM